VEAFALESEQVNLIQLEVALRSSQRPEEIRLLEGVLIEMDYRVYEILDGVNVSGVRAKRDLRDDVIKRGEELLALANSAVQALRQQQRSQSADLIQRRANEIQLVIADLKAVTTEADIGRLEGRLFELEFLLTDDLSTVGRPVDLEEFRRLLITGAEGLRTWAQYELEQLKKQGNATQEVTRIENEVRLLADIVGQLQNATTRAELQRLETLVSDTEFRLFEDLLRLESPEAYRQQLILIAGELAVRASVEVRLLAQQNRELEAVGLVAEIQNLIRLNVELMDASTNEQIQALEQRLRGIEERVYMLLRQLGNRN